MIYLEIFAKYIVSRLISCGDNVLSSCALFSALVSIMPIKHNVMMTVKPILLNVPQIALLSLCCRGFLQFSSCELCQVYYDRISAFGSVQCKQFVLVSVLCFQAVVGSYIPLMSNFSDFPHRREHWFP